jgi:hypothetical protein
MPTKTGIGFSTKTDSFIAGKEAAGIAITAIQNDTPNLVLCFCSDKHEPHEFLAGVRSQTAMLLWWVALLLAFLLIII